MKTSEREIKATKVAFSGKRVRISLVISGAVSLGAYEAGALSALLDLIRRSDGRIVVDTIVGASAGSITGLLLAHTLLTGAGLDDQEVLWVNKTSLDNLLLGETEGRPPAPLSPRRLIDWAKLALDARGEPLQTEPIYLVFSIANLRGISYRMAMHGRDQTIRADTFRDRATFPMTTNSDRAAWRSAMAAAVASSAHAFAFSAFPLERTQAQYPPKVDWPDGTERFWYTDGGTVYNEPIGFAIDAVYSPAKLHLPPRQPAEPELDRLFLLIHAHPADPLRPWPSDGRPPTFGQSSLRAFNMQREQSVYEDLLRLEEYNGRLMWRRELQDKLQQSLEASGVDEASWLSDLASDIRNATRVGETTPSGEELAEQRVSTQAEDLEIVLDAATGTGGKHFAWVELVSPELDPRWGHDGVDAGDLLAGEGLGHFLGFASEKARRSDFRLGFTNFAQWWGGTPQRDGFAERTGMSDLEPPARDWGGWDFAGHFSLHCVDSRTKRRWLLQILWRYLREIRRFQLRLRHRT